MFLLLVFQLDASLEVFALNSRKRLVQSPRFVNIVNYFEKSLK